LRDALEVLQDKIRVHRQDTLEDHRQPARQIVLANIDTAQTQYQEQERKKRKQEVIRDGGRDAKVVFIIELEGRFF
jgi:hypothetical protein